MPLISIILPTYKEAPQLTRALKSVIFQTFQDWELLIIDDGLTNDAILQLEAFQNETRIQIITNQENSGIQKSLNSGLRQASGKYIARIDDDDVWHDIYKLERQVNFLEQNSDYVLVGTNAIIVDEYGIQLGTYAMPQTDVAIRARLLSKNCFLHPTILARKDAIEKVGGYNETLEVRHIEDYALWLELGLVGKLANLSDPMVELTIHSQSVTFQNRIIQAKRMLSLIKQYKQKYPRYYLGVFLLGLRIAGFTFIAHVPFPKTILYWIQKIYKKI